MMCSGVFSRLLKAGGLVPTLLAVVALAVCIATPQAGAQAATVTTLAVTSGGSAVTTVAQGTVVTLTAKVKAGSTTLTRGLVNFCVVSTAACTDVHLLGSAQLTAAGTAAIKLRGGPGSHSWKAVFAGTTNYASSASIASSLTVTPQAGPTPTTALISSITGSVGNYSLTAHVSGTAAGNPTGMVSFLDATEGNSVIATASVAEWLHAASLSNIGYPQVGEVAPGALGYAAALAVADFNGDGIPDIASANNTNSVTILLGNGDGTFTAVTTSSSTGTVPNSIAVADFNEDGIPDLAVSSAQSGGITILLGNGDGTFTAGTRLTLQYSQYISAGDFNGDGLPDIAASSCFNNACSLKVFLGNGNGMFTAVTDQQPGVAISPIVVADFNGDGVLDLASSGGILLGDGDGTFTALSNSKGGTVVCDCNEDGTPELYGGYAVGDFNGDGHADLITVLTEISVGNGNGTFQNPYSFDQSPTGSANVASDFDGDGRSDLAVNNAPRSTDGTFHIAVYRSEAWISSATVTGAAVLPGGTGQHQVVVSYAGDSTNSPSVSRAATLTAAKGTPTVVVTGPSGKVPYGTTVTLTATVTGAGPAATGSVIFYNGATPLGSATLNSGGVATKSTTTLAVGPHSITATYEGDTNYLTATSAPDTVTVGPYSVITSPTAGSTLAGPSVTFTWSAVPGATAYQLWLGSTGVNSSNLFNTHSTTATSVTVTLPTNGETIYVRLFTNNGGTWTSINYTYTAAAAAVLTSPAPGGKVTGPSMKFTWSAAAPTPTAYQLWVGTTGVASHNVYSSGPITATSATISGLPTSGTVYVRLYTEFGSTWVHTDYTFTAN